MHTRITPQRKRQRGFSLAEILVTTAIFAIIMLAALAVYDRSNQVFKNSAEAADLQQSTRIGFDKLISEVRIAGFDYSRGGIPTLPGEYPQPDEQIEYAGTSSIVFRANLDYYTNAANDNGLEPFPGQYYAVNPTSGGPYFPYISTNNNEVVAYVLRSATASANNKSISYYVDSSIPRRAYPGGSAERAITISGIDTTNQNPPYTLYRVTLADALAGNLGTPVADNIRSLTFSYYTDLKGTALLKNADNSAITAAKNADGSTDSSGGQTGTFTGNGAIGGDGQYDPNNVGAARNFADRQQRALIQSIRVQLIGMNANQDTKYTNPAETDTTSTQYTASTQNYRTYALQSLVVPRNLGLTGFAEPNYNQPGPPTIIGICTGICAVPTVCWTPPTAGGPVVKYNIAWDTNPQGAFTSNQDINNPAATFYQVPDIANITPSTQYYYRLTAVNDNGSSIPSQAFPATPTNAVNPGPASTFVISGGNGVPAQTNQVTLSWKTPDHHAGNPSLTCNGSCSADASLIPQGEQISYEIWRGTDPNFQPQGAHCVKVLTPFSTKQPPSAAPGATVTWIDNIANSPAPPASCTQYYYRIKVVNRCAGTNQYNVNGATGASTWYPDLNQTASPGQATANDTPAAVANLAVDAAHSAQDSPAGFDTVVLNWSKVTTDTAGNAVGVDTYRITRYRTQGNGQQYVVDPSFSPLDVNGFTNDTNGTASWTDTTGPSMFSPGNGNPSQTWYYAYTVAPKICGNYGAESNMAYFPTLCSINPVIIEQGGLGSGGNGDSIATAWILNGGDTITVTPPNGANFTLTQVTFTVTAYPSGAAVGQPVTINAPGPFSLTWSDQAGGYYVVTIRVTNSNNCTETHVKYVEEQPPAACGFNQPANPAPAVALSGSTATASLVYSLTNIYGTDSFIFDQASPVFQGQVFVTWHDPDGQHHDMNMTSIQWATGAYSSSDNFTIPGGGNSGGIQGSTLTTTRSAPNNMPNVAAAGTMSLTVRFQYTGGNGAHADPALATSPITSLCIAYRIPSEPSTTKFCNIIGTTANNPTACN